MQRLKSVTWLRGFCGSPITSLSTFESRNITNHNNVKPTKSSPFRKCPPKHHVKMQTIGLKPIGLQLRSQKVRRQDPLIVAIVDWYSQRPAGRRHETSQLLPWDQDRGWRRPYNDLNIRAKLWCQGDHCRGSRKRLEWANVGSNCAAALTGADVSNEYQWRRRPGSSIREAVRCRSGIGTIGLRTYLVGQSYQDIKIP